MTVLPGFALSAPWALLGLLAIPLVWLLARAVPAPPRREVFPPAALLAHIKTDEETPRRSPWWLLALRKLAIAALTLGLAGPVLNPTPQAPDPRPLIVIIDDSWASGPHWRAITAEARSAIEQTGGSVHAIFTAPDKPRIGALDALSPSEAVALIQAAAPKPWSPDHVKAFRDLEKMPINARVLWFSDGLDHEGTQSFVARMARLGPVQVRTPETGAVALIGLKAREGAYQAQIQAALNPPSPVTLMIVDNRGRMLGEARVRLPAQGGTLSTTIPIEAPLARRAAAVRIENLESAAAVRLLGAGDRRPRVGLVAPATDAQPLVADGYFLQRALSPVADVSRGDVSTLLSANVDALVLPDAIPQGAEAEALRSWVAKGGLLIRYAGPRFSVSPEPGAAAPSIADELLPAPLRGGVRTLDGGVAFAGALGIGPIPSDSPLAGLPVPTDVKIRSQVLIDPAANPAPSIWASLSDGTPLVASRTLGEGRMIFVTTSAGPAWGDLALSGFQPAMLSRFLQFANSGNGEAGAEDSALSQPLPPRLLIDGLGRLRPPVSDDLALTPALAARGAPMPSLAPGIYAGNGAARQIAVLKPASGLKVLSTLPPGAERAGAPSTSPIPLGGWLLALGLGALFVDTLAALMIAGRLPYLRARAAPRHAGAQAATALLMLVGASLVLTPLPARAAAPPPLELRLAYVETGDSATDALALAGLRGLSAFVKSRTAAEPGQPIGVDLATDDLGAFPILFWIVPPSPSPPDRAVAAKVRGFLANGGMLFVDTRGNANAGRVALQGIALPPLMAIPDGHTLTRAFYLLRSTPGRQANARLFVETTAAASDGTGDGASSVLLGDGDWASAWALDPQGRPLYTVEGGDRGREMAFRLGTNVVIYALTGTYKSDQVHVPALLDRLR